VPGALQGTVSETGGERTWGSGGLKGRKRKRAGGGVGESGEYDSGVKGRTSNLGDDGVGSRGKE